MSETRTFVIEVVVTQDGDGNLLSRQRLQSSSDVEISKNFSGTGGIEEAAWALLTEAVRSEMLLQSLLRMEADPSFKMAIVDQTIDSVGLKNDVRTQIIEGIDHVLPRIIEEGIRVIRKKIIRGAN